MPVQGAEISVFRLPCFAMSGREKREPDRCGSTNVPVGGVWHFVAWATRSPFFQKLENSI
jgi:hypothetical protein